VTTAMGPRRPGHTAPRPPKLFRCRTAPSTLTEVFRDTSSPCPACQRATHPAWTQVHQALVTMPRRSPVAVRRFPRPGRMTMPPAVRPLADVASSSPAALATWADAERATTAWSRTTDRSPMLIISASMPLFRTVTRRAKQASASAGSPGPAVTLIPEASPRPLLPFAKLFGPD
jgi:hypothetical protein